MTSLAPERRVDVLVLGAHGPDLRGLRAHLGETLVGELGGLFVCAKTVGIGMPVAAASASKRAFQLDPRAVVHLGTCGVYPGLSQYRPHDVIVSSRIDLLDVGCALGKCALPEPMQTELAPDSMLSAGLGQTGARTRPAPVASPLSHTTDEALAATVATRFHVHGENLEAFAIAHACLLAQVPFTCVLGVTHVIGARAAQDRKQFERDSTIAAAEVLVTWLVNGARGLRHG